MSEVERNESPAAIAVSKMSDLEWLVVAPGAEHSAGAQVETHDGAVAELSDPATKA